MVESKLKIALTRPFGANILSVVQSVPSLQWTGSQKDMDLTHFSEE